jgi:hypothetical protein
MKNILTPLLVALTLFSNNTVSFAQPLQPATEIYIIGVLHNGNKYINHKTLYNTLTQLKPDVILWEYNEDFKPVFGLRTARFLKIAKVGIEQLALNKYAKKHKNHKIFGFDTLIVNRKIFLKQSTENEQKLFGILDTVLMDKNDSLAFLDYGRKSNFYYEFILNNRLEDINKIHITDTSRTIHQWDMERIVPLSKKYISDTVLAQKYIADLFFWIARNEFMVKKIQGFMDKYPGKRIVILTGLNHKYFLTDGLLADKQRTFVLKELADQ